MSETSSNAIPAYLPLRNDLIGEEPYGAPQLDVPVCLNVNENPYAPEPAVVETIAQRVKEIAPTLNRYPDREHIELRKAFSTYLERESGVKLSVDQLWGANGSNEIMLQLFQAFGGPGRRRARPAHARPGRRRATHHPDPARLAPGHAPVPARGGRGQAPGAGSGRDRGRGRRAFPHPRRAAPCHVAGPDLLVGLRHRRLPCL